MRREPNAEVENRRRDVEAASREDATGGAHDATGRGAAWARFAIGVGILSAFFWFLTTRPVPPGVAGQIIDRNLREDVQADALFYADLERMPAIEKKLHSALIDR